MKKIKLLHSNLDQIVDSLEKFSPTELESFFGGGSGTLEDPYTWEEYCALDSIPDGCWYTFNGHTYQSAGDTDIYNGSSYNGSSYNGCSNADQTWTTQTQFSGYKDTSDKEKSNCYGRCQEMLQSTGTTSAGEGNKIMMTENDHGRAGKATGYVSKGISTIEENLRNGRPVIVGVDYKSPDPAYNEGITDHFIVITGMKKTAFGETIYSFYDPATKWSEYGTKGNYLKLGSDGRITGSFTKNGSVVHKYTVTQVRPNR